MATETVMLAVVDKSLDPTTSTLCEGATIVVEQLVVPGVHEATTATSVS